MKGEREGRTDGGSKGRRERWRDTAGAWELGSVRGIDKVAEGGREGRSE